MNDIEHLSFPCSYPALMLGQERTPYLTVEVYFVVHIACMSWSNFRECMCSQLENCCTRCHNSRCSFDKRQAPVDEWFVHIIVNSHRNHHHHGRSQS